MNARALRAGTERDGSSSAGRACPKLLAPPPAQRKGVHPDLVDGVRAIMREAGLMRRCLISSMHQRPAT